MKKILAPIAALFTAMMLLTSPLAAASDVTAHGTFTGASDHITTGGISVVSTASGHLVILEGDFSLDGAPDPILGFGKAGKFDISSKISKLDNLTGAQIYQVPAGVDISSYDEFYVWCEKFSVPLGVAALK